MVTDLEKLLADEQASIQLLDITVDVFGFSRGAAGARYAIHRIVQDRVLHTKLSEINYDVGQVNVLFAGLYDTVASYGVAHYNDTTDLSLDAISRAENTLHLCAAEEHRENFRLTNINSTGSKGREIFLPGVHSDVGGGYLHNASEKVLLFKGSKKEAEEEQRQLIASGWYDKEELAISSKAFGAYYHLTGTRKSISNQYSYIPLHTMSRYAKKTGIQFSPRLTLVFKIPEKLSTLQLKLDGYVDNGVSVANDWINRQDQTMQDLRHQYLHFSADYEGIGMDPEWENGRRTRVNQDG